MTQIFYIIGIFVLPLVVTSNVNQLWNLHGTSGNGYYLQVKIGSPPTSFNLLLDTGSSNLAIAGDYYPGIESFYIPKNSSSFIENGTNVEISYYQGKLTGYLGKDLVQIPSLSYSLPVLTDLAIITNAEDIYVDNSHWQGILGLAYKKIAKPKGMVIPWLDSLANVTNNGSQIFSLELCGPDPKSRVGTHKGRFTLNSNNTLGFSTPIVTQRFYEISISQLRIGNSFLDLPCSDFNTPRTIIDCGTTNLQFSSNTFYLLVEEMKKEMGSLSDVFEDTFWYDREEICFNSSVKPWDFFPDITVFLNHNEESHFGVSIPARSFIRPLYDKSNASLVCYHLGIEKSHVGTVLGAVFLEGLIATFDRRRKIILFESSDCGPDIVFVPIEEKKDKRSCIFPASTEKGTVIASSIIVILVLLPLLFAFGKWVHKQVTHQRATGSVPFVSLSDTVT